MKPKSETLFHFTKSLDTLQLILDSGFWPRYCLEDVSWLAAGTQPESGFISVPMVCFCDIPLSRIDEHVNFYGSYGLGMTKEWALKNGLAPIHYVTDSSPFTAAFTKICELSMDDTGSGPDEPGETWQLTQRLAMYMKPLIGSMSLGNDRVQKDFYQESEWRYIAINDEVRPYLGASEHQDAETQQTANESSKTQCMLMFLPSDVRYIFVRSDADIPHLMNFIQSKLDRYPAAELKILMSRVTSLESVRRDW
jgi:hypothetical protein